MRAPTPGNCAGIDRRTPSEQPTDELLPHLTRSPTRRAPTALVLMLHGLDRSADPLDHRSPSWLRMRLMLSQLQGGWRRAGVEAWLLRYRFGGWSTGAPGHRSPVADTRWALDRARAVHGDVPVVLLGHSMGGRVAVSVADDPSVRGVVALAPWLTPEDAVGPLTGKVLRAAHGRADRTTSFAATQEFVRRAATVAASSELVDMGDRGHYLLTGITAWNRFAVDAVRLVLRP